MKLRTISMIALVVIVATTSIGVFIEKMDANPEHPHASILITGMKNNYTINEPITFSVIAEGYGTGCGATIVTITKENDSQYHSPGWEKTPQCVSNTKLYYFKYTVLSGNTLINQTGNYTLQVSFNDLVANRNVTTGMQFSVISSTISQNNAGPTSIHVANTNFTLNYAITSDNKLLNATNDLTSKTLTLSLETSSNGTLTVSIPRALVDAKLPNGQDDKFYVLIDKVEATFKETKTSDTQRVLEIPFANGANAIKIIGGMII